MKAIEYAEETIAQFGDVDEVDLLFEERAALRMARALLAFQSRAKLLERCVQASRLIRAKYPGGKSLWFSEFSEFEDALSALDAHDKQATK